MGLLHNIFHTRVEKHRFTCTNLEQDMRLMLVEWKRSRLDITAGNIHNFESFELPQVVSVTYPCTYSFCFTITIRNNNH